MEELDWCSKELDDPATNRLSVPVTRPSGSTTLFSRVSDSAAVPLSPKRLRPSGPFSQWKEMEWTPKRTL